MAQREIKFRIFNGSQMEYKVMVGYLGAYYVAGIDEKDTACLSPFNTKYQDEVQVMQFTGLKDKHGKDIYEGDILKVHIFTQELGEGLGVREGEKEFNAEICFQEMGLWLQGDTEEESAYILWIDGLHEESFEIIGNIFENPSLITK